MTRDGHKLGGFLSNSPVSHWKTHLHLHLPAVRHRAAAMSYPQAAAAGEFTYVCREPAACTDNSCSSQFCCVLAVPKCQATTKLGERCRCAAREAYGYRYCSTHKRQYVFQAGDVDEAVAALGNLNLDGAAAGPAENPWKKSSSNEYEWFFIKHHVPVPWDAQDAHAVKLVDLKSVLKKTKRPISQQSSSHIFVTPHIRRNGN